MRAFFRENPTITFGLGLPLLLVVVFLLVSGIPALIVPAPQYEVLYATGYFNNGQYGVQISVVNREVQVIHSGNFQANPKPRIWRYNPATGAVQEIAYILPAGLVERGPALTNPGEVSVNTPIEVPDLEGLTVDSSSIAPDGYEFTAGQGRYSGDVFTGLFYSSRYRNEAVLTKQGRNIRLPNISDYYGYNTHFIGWIVSP